jgi:excisionase family DNA binding protein
VSGDLRPIVMALLRVALTRKEAAASLGVGLTFFEEQVQPELRLIRRGSKVLVPLAELERWCIDHSAALFPDHEGAS